MTQKLFTKVYNANATVVAPADTQYVFARITGKGGAGAYGKNFGTIGTPLNWGGPGGGGGAYTLYASQAFADDVYAAVFNQDNRVKLKLNASEIASATNGSPSDISGSTVGGVPGAGATTYSTDSLDSTALSAASSLGLLRGLEVTGQRHASGAAGCIASDINGGAGGGCGNPFAAAQVGGSKAAGDYWTGGDLGGGDGMTVFGTAGVYYYTGPGDGLVGGGGGGAVFTGGTPGTGATGEIEITFIGAYTAPPEPLEVFGLCLNYGTDMQNIPSRVTRLTVFFNQEVDLSAGAFTLHLHTDTVAYDGTSQPSGMGEVPDGSILWSYGANNAIVTITFSGSNLDYSSLRDGVYALRVNCGSVKSAIDHTTYLGANKTFVFHRLFGDYTPATPTGSGNWQAIVDGTDQAVFSRVYNNSTLYISCFDFNNDSSVNSSDNLEFLACKGHRLTWHV